MQGGKGACIDPASATLNVVEGVDATSSLGWPLSQDCTKNFNLSKIGHNMTQFSNLILFSSVAHRQFSRQ